MNDCCPTVPLSATRPEPVERAAPAKTPAARGWFASLERIINTASFVSVDLTDTIFASLPRREGAPYEAVIRPSCSE
jgi:hypothetical protein